MANIQQQRDRTQLNSLVVQLRNFADDVGDHFGEVQPAMERITNNEIESMMQGDD